MSNDPVVPKLKKPSPQNLAGTKQDGEWPEYQMEHIKPWALNISKEDGRVKEFFDTNYPEFIKENMKRREDMRQKFRAHQNNFHKILFGRST